MFPFFSIAEQFQRATTLSAQRVDLPPNTFNTSIHLLKREVDSYKQRQQEIVSFDQVNIYTGNNNKSQFDIQLNYDF